MVPEAQPMAGTIKPRMPRSAWERLAEIEGELAPFLSETEIAQIKASAKERLRAGASEGDAPSGLKQPTVFPADLYKN